MYEKYCGEEAFSRCMEESEAEGHSADWLGSEDILATRKGFISGNQENFGAHVLC